MKYYRFLAEVPGGIGRETIYDKSIIPWKLKHLHVEFDGWLGAEILEVSPCFLVTERLEKELSFNFSGIVSYTSVYIELSDTFSRLHKDVIPPKFRRMIVSDKAFEDDFASVFYNGLYNQLIISDKAKDFLQNFDLGNYTIELIHR